MDREPRENLPQWNGEYTSNTDPDEAHFCQYRHIRNCRNIVNKRGTACDACVQRSGYQSSRSTTAPFGNGFYPSSLTSPSSSGPVRFTHSLCRCSYSHGCKNVVSDKTLACDACVAKGFAKNVECASRESRPSKRVEHPCACVFSHGCNRWVGTDGDTCDRCQSKGYSWSDM